MITAHSLDMSENRGKFMFTFGLEAAEGAAVLLVPMSQCKTTVSQTLIYFFYIYIM